MQVFPEKLHDALKPISWLQGRWVTETGVGRYPTMADFGYHEVLEFSCIGQPMFNFSSTSSHPATYTPMHQERGFLRIKPGTNSLAFLVSHNFGLTSLEEGQYDAEEKEINLKTVSLSRISFAKPPHVLKFERNIRQISEDTMEVVTYMETDNTPLTEHLRATYKKTKEILP